MAKSTFNNVRIQLKNDTAENWKSSTLVLLAGEFAVENDTGLFKIGNGVDVFSALPYANDAAKVAQEFNELKDKIGTIPDDKTIMQLIEEAAAGGGSGSYGVSSVNGKTGAVVLSATDVGATQQTMTGELGTATIFNESDGGGALFVRNDGIKSYVGVADGQRVNAQIYAVDSDGTGTRLNVKKDGIYYLPNMPKGTAATSDNEIATKGDLVKSSTDENKVSISNDGTMEVNSLTFDKIVQKEEDEIIISGGNA